MTIRSVVQESFIPDIEGFLHRVIDPSGYSHRQRQESATAFSYLKLVLKKSFNVSTGTLSTRSCKSVWIAPGTVISSFSQHELLVNMQAALYSVFSLLPALNECCSDHAEKRLQDRSWHIDHLMSREMFFSEFRQRNQTHRHSRIIIELRQPARELRPEA